jgi:hypothetical protein
MSTVQRPRRTTARQRPAAGPMSGARSIADTLNEAAALLGSSLGDDYPELAVCEVCGRAIEWPNGWPTLARRDT